MFKRKLIALDYENAHGFDHNDEDQYRKLVVWLEDQKIRHYKIEDREGLRNVKSEDWPKMLEQFVRHLECPLKDVSDNLGVLDWLLGYAVRLEYGDNVDKYKMMSTSSATPGKSSNPLDSLDFESADFKAGVSSLAALLQIPPHKDHLIIIKAITILITEKLSAQALEAAKSKDPKGDTFITLDKIETGFDTPDYISAEAAKILRLLHIRELRDLQTRINEAIVKVQELTADPKTDTRLGKVGR